jgi:protease I
VADVQLRTTPGKWRFRIAMRHLSTRGALGNRCPPASATVKKNDSPFGLDGFDQPGTSNVAPLGPPRPSTCFAAAIDRVAENESLNQTERSLVMADELKGKRVAFLFTEGAEQVEVTEPLKAVKKAGADVDIVSLEKGEVEMWKHFDKGDKIEADKAVSDADASDYDGLVLPGGVANPDQLRGDKDAVRFVRAFFEQDKPVGVICHGPWMLVETGVAKGRKVTSWPSLRTDLRNAGANWVDEEVVVDNGLVTSRKPDDLPAFCAKIVEEFAEGKHKQRVAA